MINSAKIFDGLRVVERGNLISAPYCGKLLAHLGAEMIKVQRPGVGDELSGLSLLSMICGTYLARTSEVLGVQFKG